MVYGVLEAYHFEEGEVEDGDFFCVDEGKSFERAWEVGVSKQNRNWQAVSAAAPFPFFSTCFAISFVCWRELVESSVYVLSMQNF
jgi:hypothetical protein